MKYLIILVLLFTSQAGAQSFTLDDLVGFCSPVPVGSEAICTIAEHIHGQIEAGEPPGPVPDSCLLGKFSQLNLITYYPDGIHAWEWNLGPVVRLDKIVSYNAETQSILLVDDAGITHIIATEFVNHFQAQTCLFDLIAARRL